MNSPNTSGATANDLRSQRLELLIIGRVLLTVGVASLSVGAAIAAALIEDVGALQRTFIGLAVSALMIGGGQLLSGRSQRHPDSFWSRMFYWG